MKVEHTRHASTQTVKCARALAPRLTPVSTGAKKSTAKVTAELRSVHMWGCGYVSVYMHDVCLQII